MLFEFVLCRFIGSKASLPVSFYYFQFSVNFIGVGDGHTITDITIKTNEQIATVIIMLRFLLAVILTVYVLTFYL